MEAYQQITFNNLEIFQQEILMAQLADVGYDGFEENDNVLKAFIPSSKFDTSILQSIAFKHQFEFTVQEISPQNWNAVWEAGFSPVTIASFAGIRAHFHSPLAGVQHEIIITPKMSFGTGHHATTSMMIELMSELDFKNKSVFDFGTGTGVLAILAEKCGAIRIDAIDNDEWSITNSRENAFQNNTSQIHFEETEELPPSIKYSIVLANINKNVLLGTMAGLQKMLLADGELLLSGLLEQDEGDILNSASGHGLKLQGKRTKNNWIALKFTL